jgi:type VI secretion system protein
LRWNPFHCRRLTAATLATILLAAGGCSGPPTLALRKVAVEAQRDANDNGAVPVDLALATKPGVAEILAKLSAAEWFSRKSQLQRDYPDGLTVFSWELIPGQSVSAESSVDALDGYVFGGYLTPGDHRVRLGGDDEAIRILLQSSDFVVVMPKDSR